MKKLFLFAAFLFFVSCQEEGESARLDESVISSNAVLKYYGNFVPTSGISVTGNAKIYKEGNRYKVELDNFSISNGPDLKVYLSKSSMPSGFVNLGSLTSETVYPIPADVDPADYSHILIHCQQHNHLYAVASLIQN